MLLISNDTVVWHDKTGTPYLYLSPGLANAGIVLSGDWSWRAFPWAHPDALLHDSMVRASAGRMTARERATPSTTRGEQRHSPPRSRSPKPAPRPHTTPRLRRRRLCGRTCCRPRTTC
jgi:hypothetical protein